MKLLINDRISIGVMEQPICYEIEDFSIPQLAPN